MGYVSEDTQEQVRSALWSSVSGKSPSYLVSTFVGFVPSVFRRRTPESDGGRTLSLAFGEVFYEAASLARYAPDILRQLQESC